MSLFTESKWNDSDVETLISLIQANPVLWNSSCKDYKDTNARNLAFNSIAQEVNTSSDEVRKKYRNLRSQYVREVRLIRQRGYGTRWNFFGALKFLSSGITSLKNDNWDTIMSEDTQDHVEQIPIATRMEAHSTEEDKVVNEQYAEDYLEEYISVTCDDNCETNANSLPTPAKPKSSFQIETNDDNKRKLRPTALIAKQPQSRRDEYDVLGEQVANELRALQYQPALLQTLKCTILRAILEVNKAINDYIF